MKITVLRGTTGFVVDAVLRQNGTPIDLTTAVSVTFRARTPKSTTPITATCTVLDAPNGSVRMTLGATQTALVGAYNGVFLITYAGSATTVPNTEYINYQVLESV